MRTKAMRIVAPGTPKHRRPAYDRRTVGPASAAVPTRRLVDRGRFDRGSAHRRRDAARDAPQLLFVPSLAIYQLAYEIWTGQQKVASERARLAKIVNDELRRGRPGPVSTKEWQRLRDAARDIQDGILRTRLDTTRVPEWFYTRFREVDERDFADTAEGHRLRLSHP